MHWAPVDGRASVPLSASECQAVAGVADIGAPRVTHGERLRLATVVAAAGDRDTNC
jgi:hypothetical protein